MEHLQLRCASCGAENNRFADRCWRCGVALGPEKPPVERPRRSGFAKVLLVLLGVFGGLAAFVFAVVVALFVMCLSTLRGL